MSLDIAGAIARGGKQAETMAEENSSFSGSKFESINWFSLKNGQSKIYRFLDDHHEWLSVMQHPFALTRPAPDSYTDEQKQRWPKQMNPVCRKTPQFVQFFPDGCYLCDLMHGTRPNPNTKAKGGGKWYPQVRVWARAVEREEVLVTEENQEQYPVEVIEDNAHEYPGNDIGAMVLRPIGEVLGYRDAEDEVDETDAEGNATGKKIKKKRIVVFNMALRNFFGPLQGYADVYKTVLDRDYHITRKGEKKDTDYNIVPMNPITRADGSVLDMRGPELVDGKSTGRKLRDAYLDDGPDTIKLIEDRIDDGMYHRFFDDRYPIPERESDKDEKKGGDAKAAPTQQVKKAPSASQNAPEAPAAAAPSGDAQAATKAKLAAMRNRVKGDNPAPAADPAPEASVPDAAAEEKPKVAASTGPIDFS